MAKMIARIISESILKVKDKMPVIVITGPRQSGKTTLVKSIFKDYHYHNLEFPDTRFMAKNDPRGFLRGIEQGIIIDEVQYLPELLSYIQALTDEKQLLGKIVLTGSQNLQLMQSVTQSLAGRAAVFNLLPFSLEELSAAGKTFDSYEEYLFTGSFPPIYDRDLKPREWLPSYIQTFIERDLRQIINVKDLTKFQLVLKLLAGRTAQLLNINALANEAGIDNKTVKAWISVLETGYIIKLLKPHHRNFNKRLIKSPKLYFCDTGLACQLLGIRSADELFVHSAKGALFENMIIAEALKKVFNSQLNRDLFFWRDRTGNEIDLLTEDTKQVSIVEIKSGRTFRESFLKNLNYYKKISDNTPVKSFLVFGGNETLSYKDTEILAWNDHLSFIKP